VLCALLAIAVLLLLWKLWLLRRSAEELRRGVQERLETDTNTLLSIPSRDGAMCRLAAGLNVQLRQLRRERQQYQNGDRDLKEAVTNVSHDLRTPLTAICGYLELLERGDKTPDQARYLSLIAGRAQAMRQLTEELLRYSVAASLEADLALEPVDLNGAAEEAAAALYGAFMERGIVPAVSLPEERVVRMLDRAALSRVLGNLRDWFAQPIFSPDGLLTVGYAYPNLLMSECYNAPGSPYWALKTFLCLALPEDHPFWQAGEEIPVLDSLRALPQARMLIARSGEQVQLFPAGQSCVCQLGQVGPKYEKLVYSSRFGFSVPRGDSLEEGAFDSCLAVSEAGEDHWRTQRGFDAWTVSETQTWRRFSPMRGVWVEVTVTPCFPSHRRDYIITTDRPIDAADGGFAIPAEHAGLRYREDMVEWSGEGVTARFPWGVSGIRSEKGGGRPVLVSPWPNTNLLAPFTRIPIIRWRLEPGTHRLTTLVTGSLPGA